MLSILAAPFDFVTGKGFGVSHSSIAQTGFSVLPSKDIGSAKIHCAINGANGNLFVRSQGIKIEEASGMLELGFIYNSLANEKPRELRKKLMLSVESDELKIILREADGREVKFEYDAKAKGYIAKEFEHNKPIIAFDENLKRWVLKNPINESVELYNQSGLLTERIDDKNHTTKFYSDDHYKWKRIEPASVGDYELKKENDKTDKCTANEKPWQLSLKKLILSKETDELKIILREADGCEVKFEYDAIAKCYIAAEFENGRPTIFFDENLKSWILKNPANETIEVFNPSGLLTERTDNRNRSTKFHYSGHDLKKITTANGSEYEIRTENNQTGKIVSIVKSENKKQEQIIQTYQFDLKNNLIQSKTGDGYEVVYKYKNNNLSKIIQSDSTELEFKYEDNILNGVELGNKGEKISYIIQNASPESPSQATVIDPSKTIYQVKFSDEAQLLECKRFRADQSEINMFKYNNNGQLRTHIDPSKNETHSWYNSYGLIQERVHTNGTITRFYYSQEKHPVLIAKSKILKSPEKVLSKHYVYETTKEGSHLIRFSISPTGRVKEFCYELNALKEIREYTRDFFCVNELLEVPIKLESIQAWCKNQPANKVKLTEVKENRCGQITEKKCYATIDKNGQGVADNKTSCEFLTFNDSGDLLNKNKLQQNNIIQSESYTYDLLGRKKTEENALKQKVITEFNKNEKKTTYPNGSQHIISHNSRGSIDQKTIVGKNSNGIVEAHNTQYVSSEANKVLVQMDADGEKTYSIYDYANRVKFKISHTGIVTEYIYNSRPHYIETILYDHRIDTAVLNETLINEHLVSGLIQSSQKKDLHEWQFLDASKRTVLTIDAEKFVTQPIYDGLHRDCGQSRFKNSITEQVLNELKTKGVDAWTPENNEGRLSRNFYDDDNLLIATADTAGYITYFKRDGAGDITDEIIFKEKVINLTPQSTFAELKIDTLTEHAHTYYFNDARGQVILEVDPEGYITTFDRLANGLIKISHRYAKKIDTEWFANTSTAPIPVPDEKDQIIESTYDLLDRPIAQQKNNGQKINTHFDEMGNETLNSTIDVNQQQLTGDTYRARQKRYDGFNRVTAELNPHVALKLAQLEADKTLSADVIAAKREQIWQESSTRYTLNNCGLILTDTNSLGYITRYFYDKERRLVATIDAAGGVIQKIYDNRNNCTTVRVHKNRLKPEDFSTLSGGLVDERLIELFCRNQTELDSVETKKYDRRNLPETKIDAEENISEYRYNAFKELVSEHLPIESKEPTLNIVHERDDRGLEIKTTKQATGSTLKITTQQEFNHPAGLVTKKIDGNLVETQFEYDKLNRLETVSKDNCKLITLHDAFDQVIAETDALNHTIYHDHDPKSRTEIVKDAENVVIARSTKNIFTEPVAVSDALGNIQKTQHSATGNIIEHRNALEQTDLIAKYNNEGWLEQQTDVQSIITKIDHNEVGQVKRKIEDLGGLNLTTICEPNVFGKNEKVTQPNGTVTENNFNRKQELTKSILDPKSDVNPKGLNQTTDWQINAAGKIKEITKGDDQHANQWHQKVVHDELGRIIGNVSAPKTLHLVTEKHLDATSKVIYEKDQDGHEIRVFYNALGQKRFTVNAEGGVTE